jgi:hypothetical protein
MIRGGVNGYNGVPAQPQPKRGKNATVFGGQRRQLPKT